MSVLKDIAVKVMRGEVVLSESELAQERLKVCVECDAFRKLTRQCSLCNCFMDVKTKFLAAECPMELW